MIAAALAVLALQAEAPGAELSYFRYLAPHQLSEGSWGRRPPGCACPEAPPPPDPLRVARLLDRLGHEDLEVRNGAEAELEALGPGLLPALRDAPLEEAPEPRGRRVRLRDRLSAICRGAGELETTATVLLAFLGAGYSHLSKENYDGLGYGDVVRRGLEWLMARQREDGVFDPLDPGANAMAALALSEAYGLTASGRYQEKAQRAVKAAAGVELREPRALIWTAALVESARLSGLDVDPRFVERLLDRLEGAPGPREAAARAKLRLPASAVDADALERRAPATLDPETRLLVAATLFAVDGREGRRWKTWSLPFRKALPALPAASLPRCERGAEGGEGLGGRLRATALAAQAWSLQQRAEHRCFCSP